MKEKELNHLYASDGGGGGAKRKVESLVIEQEKLNARIQELDVNQNRLLQDLSR